jgi:hypothetical protein
VIVQCQWFGVYRNGEWSARGHASVVDDDVPQDGKKPRARHASLGFIRMRVTPRPQEHLLHDILDRRGVGHPAPGEPAEVRFIGVPQSAEPVLGPGVNQVGLSNVRVHADEIADGR